MDYNDTSNIKLMRIYCSTDRKLPLEEWTVYGEVPFDQKMIDMEVNLAPEFNDDAPMLMHYFYSTFVYADGVESRRSQIQSAAPGTDAASGRRQNPELN